MENNAGPPLGLIPPEHSLRRGLDRMLEIKEASLRYFEANKPIPVVWVTEYNNLCSKFSYDGIMKELKNELFNCPKIDWEKIVVVPYECFLIDSETGDMVDEGYKLKKVVSLVKVVASNPTSLINDLTLTSYKKIFFGYWSDGSIISKDEPDGSGKFRFYIHR
jgi:hypothetical protein